MYQFRSQFRPEYFASIPPPLENDNNIFRILYAGRVTRDKGVFDVLAIAHEIQVRAPGRVHWSLCGSGHDLEQLRHQHSAMGLETVVSVYGWTSPEKMRDILGECHASIVPTRSDFAEGMAKTVVESVLSGRPVITTPVVPALEMLRSACVEARTDDVESYVDVIFNLIANPDLYRSLCEACPPLQRQFYDPNQGFTVILGQVFEQERFFRP